MLPYVQARALVHGILSADNATKQELGRRFAAHLGLTPGPRGADDGVDGFGVIGGRKIHFQCRLRSRPVDKDDARTFYSDLKYHKAELGVFLAGVGYKEPFLERLFGHPDISEVRILTLWDLFEETAAYRAALGEMPALGGLTQVAADSQVSAQPNEAETPDGEREADPNPDVS